ncbi:hypothetical protein H6F77_25720 [Microcoleus sp. FACHB-831]|jgi:hypothetical protein|uniref:hypothetical protein n=1 Tax=Microcoleus sp. FACHB-831 TaxID=2692827 RepID=UPI001689816F|nr:hypothetical protein [Microcoleus sp. FACHB-831]MBD1924438.1 hypothetical protein [Microcoleus sp. FACHB-831]
MKDIDPLENKDINRLQMFFYLVPVVGVFPSLWTLYRRQGNREQQSVSRLSVTLALAWVSAYVLLGAGAQISEISQELTLRLLFMNSMLTSSYFLVCVWLMVRLSQRKQVRLPGISRLADRVARRRLL